MLIQNVKSSIGKAQKMRDNERNYNIKTVALQNRPLIQMQY